MIQRRLRSRVIQAKLKISQPDDKYEQEADRVAEEVMRMPHCEIGGMSKLPTTIQKKCAVCASGKGFCPKCEGDERIERKPLLSAITPSIRRQSEAFALEKDEEPLRVTQEVPNRTRGFTPESEALVSDIDSGGGQPLPESVRAIFEPRFGYDFSRVRVHTNARATDSALAVNALAYTIGWNIVFGAGQYAPETTVGQQLLAHELAHVIQQSGTCPRLQRQERKDRETALPTCPTARTVFDRARNRFIVTISGVPVAEVPIKAAQGKASIDLDIECGMSVFPEAGGISATVTLVHEGRAELKPLDTVELLNFPVRFVEVDLSSGRRSKPVTPSREFERLVDDLEFQVARLQIEERDAISRFDAVGNIVQLINRIITSDYFRTRVPEETRVRILTQLQEVNERWAESRTAVAGYVAAGKRAPKGSAIAGAVSIAVRSPVLRTAAVAAEVEPTFVGEVFLAALAVGIIAVNVFQAVKARKEAARAKETVKLREEELAQAIEQLSRTLREPIPRPIGPPIAPPFELPEPEKRRRRRRCDPVWKGRDETKKTSDYTQFHNAFAREMVNRLGIGAPPDADYSISKGGLESTDYDSFDSETLSLFEFKTLHEYLDLYESNFRWEVLANRLEPQAADQDETRKRCVPGAILVWIWDNERAADGSREELKAFGVDYVAAEPWEPPMPRPRRRSRRQST